MGLFNVVTAIYVERTVDAAKSNGLIQRNRRFSDKLRVEKLTGDLVAHFFHAANGDADLRKSSSEESLHQLQLSASKIEHTCIARETFKEVMEREDVMKILSNLDIAMEDCLDLDGLFNAF